jgi:hypothetical protein
VTGEPRRRKRLSADLPQHWLHDPMYWSLTDRAWRLHTHAHMWAIGRTDGFIPDSMLSMLLAGSDSDRELALKELVSAGLWLPVTGGWQIPRWHDTQASVEEIENHRKRWREKKQRQRANVPGGTTQGDSPGGVRNVTSRQGLGPQGGDKKPCDWCGQDPCDCVDEGDPWQQYPAPTGDPRGTP